MRPHPRGDSPTVDDFHSLEEGMLNDLNDHLEEKLADRTKRIEEVTSIAIVSLAKLTGCPVMVNTSFNVRGEPIVCTPEEAYRCFMRTQMDLLVIEDFMFLKDEQPLWDESGEWKDQLTLD